MVREHNEQTVAGKGCQEEPGEMGHGHTCLVSCQSYYVVEEKCKIAPAEDLLVVEEEEGVYGVVDH